MKENTIGLKKTALSTQYSNAYFIVIIVAMFFAPFTSLRYLRIGFTEFSCLLLTLLVVINNYSVNFKKKDDFIFTKFWLYFSLFSSVGLLYNYIFLKKSSGTITDALFDTLAYIVVFLTCFSIETIIYNNKLKSIEMLIKKIFFASSFVLTFLFYLSRSRAVFGSFQLVDTANNFKPIADNIHHVAMYVGPLPFIGLYLFMKEKQFWKKALIIIFILSDIMIIFNTGSSKAIMGLLLGIVVVMLKLVLDFLSQVKKGEYLSLAFITLFVILMMINIHSIIPLLIQIFVENDGGGARASLYSIGFKKSLNSILVGYGPGKHSLFANGINADTHQTFLTVLLQSGILGLIAYLGLLVKVIKVYWGNAYLLGASCSIIIYILGGDVLRRLPIWIFMVLFYYLIKNRHKKIKV